MRCDERFTHAFTACGCVFKVITLVGSNQGNYFENLVKLKLPFQTFSRLEGFLGFNNVPMCPVNVPIRTFRIKCNVVHSYLIL